LYFLCEQIAEGSFGRIFLAIHALTKQKVAIKILDKKRLGADAFRVRGEIDALKRLSHPNIYSLYQVIETEASFYLIVEYLSGGELFDYILQKGSLSEFEARSIFRELVSAIGYAHQKGVAHRDLKPNTDNTLLDTFCGSLAYAAPEILANKEYSGHAKGKYDVDESLSKSSRHLLSRLLCVDPEKRINMQELCHHPWVMGEDLEPIDLLLDLKHNLPLNSEIVREISFYTHIPKVEMSRMLRRRSYDYLMATYMIMERLYLAEGILLRLQRRDQVKSRHQPSVALGSAPSTDWEVSETASATRAPRMRPSRHHTTCGSGTRRGYMLTALSPGRSVDSQLNHLTKEFRMAEPENLYRAPSVRFDFALRGEELNNCTDDSNSSDVRIFYDDEVDAVPAPTNDDITHNAVSEVLTRSGELEGSMASTTDNGSSTASGNSVGWQSRRIFKQLLARKTLTASSAAATATGNGVSSVSKLRKVRHANNVIVTKPNLSVSEILERIAEALRKNSLRFTLKRHGFLCVFANDWGKTLLSFELEVVDISCKSNFPKLLTKRPVLGGVAAANDRAPLAPLPNTVTSGLQDPSSLLAANTSTSSGLANQSQKEASSAPASCTLGVKMKRLHGDAYTYTSLCRTILQQADVKAD
uniref:non-specific serine/threonine protein kinase n=1 Tax=Schistocephalus solidus TaxID=70667 RepID=A0A183SDZ4_SCHSO